MTSQSPIGRIEQIGAKKNPCDVTNPGVGGGDGRFFDEKVRGRGGVWSTVVRGSKSDDDDEVSNDNDDNKHKKRGKKVATVDHCIESLLAPTSGNHRHCHCCYDVTIIIIINNGDDNGQTKRKNINNNNKQIITIISARFVYDVQCSHCRSSTLPPSSGFTDCWGWERRKIFSVSFSVSAWPVYKDIN